MQTRISASVYLKKIKNEDVRKKIAEKLKLVMAMPSREDSDPPDYYRYLGVQFIKLQLIEEVNTLLMTHGTTYQAYKPWAKELWDLREHTLKMIETLKKMLRSLIFHGIVDGFYNGEDLCKKNTSPASDSITVPEK